MKGLRLGVGKHKYTWQFYSDPGDHGDRGHVFAASANKSGSTRAPRVFRC